MTAPAPMIFDELPDEVVGHIAAFTNLTTLNNIALVARKYRQVAADVKNNNTYWNRFLTVPVAADAPQGDAFIQFQNVTNRNEDGLLQDAKGRAYYARGDGWLIQNIRGECTRDNINYLQHPEWYIYQALLCPPINALFIRGELTLQQFNDPHYLCFAAIKEQLKEPTYGPLTFPYDRARPYKLTDAQLDELIPLAKNNTQSLYLFPTEIFAGKNNKEKLFNAYMERNKQLNNGYPVTSFKKRWHEFFDLILNGIAPAIYRSCVFGGLALFSLYPLAWLINQIGDKHHVRIPMLLFSYDSVVEIEHFSESLNLFNLIVAVPLGFIGAHVGSFIGFFVAAIVGVTLVPFMTIAAAVMTLAENIKHSFAKWKLNRNLAALEEAFDKSQPEAQPDAAPAAYASVSQLPKVEKVEVATQTEEVAVGFNPVTPSAAPALEETQNPEDPGIPRKRAMSV